MAKIAIMQPYLFPYLGYFSLINYTDYFIFFDTPQYIRKGWINRNKLLINRDKEVYFSVPIQKCNRETKIKDVKISYADNWVEAWKGQLTAYKKKAPYYEDVLKLVDSVIKTDNGTISNLAINSVLKTCEYIGIPINYDVYSEMKLEIQPVAEPDEWALNITSKLGYSTYVNPPGGKAFFDKKKYEEAGIKLEFLTGNLLPYNQRMKGEFIPGLSILDVLMFCSKEEIKELINNFIIE